MLKLRKNQSHFNRRAYICRQFASFNNLGLSFIPEETKTEFKIWFIVDRNMSSRSSHNSKQH